jgi:hypothetical protein
LLDEVHSDKAELLSSTGIWHPCEEEEGQVDVKPVLDGDVDADVAIVAVVKKGRQDGASRKRKFPPEEASGGGDDGWYISNKI